MVNVSAMILSVPSLEIHHLYHHLPSVCLSPLSSSSVPSVLVGQLRQYFRSVSLPPRSHLELNCTSLSPISRYSCDGLLTVPYLLRNTVHACGITRALSCKSSIATCTTAVSKTMVSVSSQVCSCCLSCSSAAQLILLEVQYGQVRLVA